MSDVDELVARIDGAFAVVKDRIRQEQQQQLREFKERQSLCAEFAKVQARIVEIARPRLEALAGRLGERAAVAPSVSECRRSVRFEFKSSKAYITLTFSVSPDRAIRNAVLGCDLQIVPVLWKYDTHAEFSTPVAAPDYAGLTRWLDDGVVAFVELFVQIHEDEIYEKAEYVEDPVARVKFPKFAAGASLELDGRTYFFIDDDTKSEFVRQKKIVTG